jgi:hypothetical protein
MRCEKCGGFKHECNIFTCVECNDKTLCYECNDDDELHVDHDRKITTCNVCLRLEDEQQPTRMAG